MKGMQIYIGLNNPIDIDENNNISIDLNILALLIRSKKYTPKITKNCPTTSLQIITLIKENGWKREIIKIILICFLVQLNLMHIKEMINAV